MKNNNKKKKKLRDALEKEFFKETDTVYNYNDIKEFAKKTLGEKNFSEGKLSGVITKMVKNDIICRVEPSKYKRIKTDKSIREILNESLDNAINEIEKELSKIEVIKLDNENFNNFNKGREILINLKSMKIS